MADKAPQEAYDSLFLEDTSTDREVMRTQIKYLRMIARDFSQYVDCVSSPLHRRIWWFVGGYHFRKVGRWYGRETLAFKIWFFIGDMIGLT